MVPKEKEQTPALKRIKIDNPDRERRLFSLRLPVDKLEQLPSGSCMIPPDQEGDRVVVCKEGKTIKIFTF